MRIFLALFLLANTANAQIVLSGKPQADAGTMQTIKVNLGEPAADDLKVTVLKNGVQTADNWYTFKTLDGDIVILCLPQPGDAQYTFIASANKAGKTHVSVHQMLIGATKPVPKPPKPEPTGNTAAYKAAYDKSPDATALAAYKSAIQKTVAVESPDWEAFQNTLAANVASSIGATALRPLRDAVAATLVKQVGPEPTVQALKDAFKQTLKELP